jgi:hypothetical protein
MNEKLKYTVTAAAAIPALGCDWISISREETIKTNPLQADPNTGRIIAFPVRGVGTVYVSQQEYSYIMIPWYISYVFWGILGLFVLVNAVHKLVRNVFRGHSI